MTIATSACRFNLMTPRQPGAIAIVQLAGDVVPVLASLSGLHSWPIGRHRLIAIDGIDEAVAGRLADDVAQVMPHGGPRVIQRVAARLVELGAAPAVDVDDLDPQALFPEASDRFEALMLLTLATAASPLAIDLLLDQLRRWREFARRGGTLTRDDLERSRRLNRLVTPPLVVIAGPANVGKSTLANALLGRSMSITLDQPGTTRDYTIGRVELAGLIVDLHDTPGIRATDDPIEQHAIMLARRLIESCDLLITMADHEHGWPALPREPDLCVMNKIDLARTASASSTMSPAWLGRISARTGEGIVELVQAVRDALVTPADLEHPGVWVFDDRLRSDCR